MYPVRFKTKQYQAFYENCRRLGEDPQSEFYYNGNQRRGAAHRCAYWDGFNGSLSLYDGRRGGRDTFGHVAYVAGKDSAKAKAKEN